MLDDDGCGDCSRRTLIRGIGVAAAASLLGVGCGGDDGIVLPPDAAGTTSGFEMCGAQLCLDLNHPANVNLVNVNGARSITIAGARVIVVRKSATEVSVLSQICTHAGCGVSYNPNLHLLVCPCHGSRFSLTGQATQGPAASPLKSYSAVLDAGTNIVTISV
jgi:nitrite reductase/ring-hydroxylating ferredoxin subunit